MTNEDKRELRLLCKEGLSFTEIRGIVDCADDTIKRYLEVFRPKESNDKLA